ncbi:MAG: hypothetical protein WCP08_16000 [Prolixibacteraceae bacterium]
MDRLKNLETCLVIVTGLLILHVFYEQNSLLIAAILIGLIGVFLEKPASWIAWLWYKIADILGLIVPKIILTLVFFIFLFPISVLSKIFRKNGPDLSKEGKNSTWVIRQHQFVKDDLTKPW